MTLLSFGRTRRRAWRRARRSHFMAIALSGLFTLGALAAIAYLLRPTWVPETSSDPGRLPVSIGGTLFNLPTKAIRRTVQKHSGPQDRVDLDFMYPSLEPPSAPKRLDASTLEENDQPIDRIFVSIAAQDDSLAPEIRARTIYPHYFESEAPPDSDGLAVRHFRNDTPYSNEDLYFAEEPAIVARCTREGDTPGMCLSERRIGGADLTFRFPRSWLAQWREVAGAMDRLTAQLHGNRSDMPRPAATRN